ncbi:Sec23/Sec24 zinc finger-containing protein [Clostridium nigeriense]|uniref:Sec23/Sec24 zinc finger-containing protein n=1 Tax=Clostridium nigeriense TaxID=1805470 RepID=UPI003D344574
MITIIIERFPNTDWWCDRCNAYLNNQSGFNDHKYIWQCTECGHKNSISGSNIYESEDYYKNQKRC